MKYTKSPVHLLFMEIILFAVSLFSFWKTYILSAFLKQIGFQYKSKARVIRFPNVFCMGHWSVMSTVFCMIWKMRRFLHNTELCNLIFSSHLFARAEFKLIMKLSHKWVTMRHWTYGLLCHISSNYILFLAMHNSFFLILLQDKVVKYSEKRKESRNMIYLKPLHSSSKIRGYI